MLLSICEEQRVLTLVKHAVGLIIVFLLFGCSVDEEERSGKTDEAAQHEISVSESVEKTVFISITPAKAHEMLSIRKDILFVDNLLTDRHVTALNWRELDNFGHPKTEVVFAHNSEYFAGPNSQASHPHCTMSDIGKWLSYNSRMNGRTDVYVAQME